MSKAKPRGGDDYWSQLFWERVELARRLNLLNEIVEHKLAAAGR